MDKVAITCDEQLFSHLTTLANQDLPKHLADFGAGGMIEEHKFSDPIHPKDLSSHLQTFAIFNTHVNMTEYFDISSLKSSSEPKRDEKFNVLPEQKIDIRLYQIFAHSKELFPFSFSIYRKFLSEKHQWCQANQTDRNLGESTGYIAFFQPNRIQLSTKYQYYTSGKITDLVGLQLKGGLSYEKLDNIEGFNMNQFWLSLPDIIKGKFDATKVNNPQLANLCIELAFLLIYVEVGRDLINLAFVVMLYQQVNVFPTSTVRFQDLPFSVEEAMDVFRYLRGKRKFNGNNIHYFYDYFIQKNLPTNSAWTDYTKKRQEICSNYCVLVGKGNFRNDSFTEEQLNHLMGDISTFYSLK